MTSMVPGLSVGAAGGVDIGFINSTLNQVVQSTEGSLNTLLTTIGSKDSPSVTDMLSLQQGLQNWTVTVQASSTVTKDFYDAIKEVIQKSG